MDRFDKWWGDSPEIDLSGADEWTRIVGELSFRAGMRAAAEIVHEVYFKGVPEKHILDAILSEAGK